MDRDDQIIKCFLHKIGYSSQNHREERDADTGRLMGRLTDPRSSASGALWAALLWLALAGLSFAAILRILYYLPLQAAAWPS